MSAPHIPHHFHVSTTHTTLLPCHIHNDYTTCMLAPHRPHYFLVSITKATLPACLHHTDHTTSMFVSEISLKMAEVKSQAICKYYNYSDFFKFISDCKSFHSQINCPNYSCKDKTSTSWHPKTCRYKNQCRIRSTYLYSHEDRSDHETMSLVKENYW